ncbi:MAG: hypothetical protein WDZ30_00665 [Cellvibrionaceae bacterium]
MDQIYLLQNQDKLFLGKHNEWLDGRDLGSLYKSHHKDEALNQLCEANIKDYSQRIQILSCTAKANGLPHIDAEQLPPPMKTPVPDTPAQQNQRTVSDDDPGPLFESRTSEFASIES